MTHSAVLLSGGMDSTALAFWKKPAVGITIDYGQVCAAAEIRAAAQVCKVFGIHHDTVRVDCSELGSGALAGTQPLPVAPVPEWWPFRNQLLVTLAAIRALSLGVQELLVGAVKTDACHQDGTEPFFSALDRLLRLQEGNLTLSTPAIAMTSAELIKASKISIDLLAWAHSCHTANYACGTCRGCNKHRQVMSELGYAPY